MTSLLKKVFLIDLFQGLWVTFRNQNPKYIYTEQYPAERPKVAERYRGAPRLNINPDNGETLCISCNLCALACPEDLIVVTSEKLPDLDGLECDPGKSVLRCHGSISGSETWTIPAGAPVVATVIGRERDPDTTNNVAIS